MTSNDLRVHTLVVSAIVHFLDKSATRFLSGPTDRHRTITPPGAYQRFVIDIATHMHAEFPRPLLHRTFINLSPRGFLALHVRFFEDSIHRSFLSSVHRLARGEEAEALFGKLRALVARLLCAFVTVS